MAYIIPKAKAILHRCRYHLDVMPKSQNFEELEINFCAFVVSARSVTFTLQKEFNKTDAFKKWYGTQPDEKICDCCGRLVLTQVGTNEGTKQHEMANDQLCKFFVKIRNKIEKEGESSIEAVKTTFPAGMKIPQDFKNKPADTSETTLNVKGAYALVFPNTSKADYLPLTVSKPIQTIFGIPNPPLKHLGENIKDKNFFEISELYYEYLKAMVEEWTEKANE